MDSNWPSILTFLGIYTFAIVSPGPNFILVSNTALTRTRHEGLKISLGVAVGSGIFGFAGLVGLLPLVHALPHFAEIMRFAGGGYLLWIGVEMMRTCRRKLATVDGEQELVLSVVRPFRLGLITNLTNPKAWAFYLSLFALVMQTTFPVWTKAIMNVVMFLISLAWYSLITLLVSSTIFRPFFLRLRPAIQGSLGIFLSIAALSILLGW